MIQNLTQSNCFAERVFYAVRALDRLRGMIGRDFSQFDAMVFEQCGAIHTCFMQHPIDVIFLDKEHKVLKIIVNLKPWRPCIQIKNAVAVIETAPFYTTHHPIQEGDTLHLGNHTPEKINSIKSILKYTKKTMTTTLRRNGE